MSKSTVYALIAIISWATLTPVTKIMLNGIPSMETLFITSFVAFLFLLPFCVFGKNKAYFKRYKAKDYLKMCGLGFLGTFMFSVFYYLGLTLMPVQEATIINYLWPVLLVLLSCIILKEKLTVMKIVALACSFFGIVILSLGNTSGMDKTRFFGTLSCIIGAASYSLFSVLNKKADYNQPITMMFMWLTTALCSLVLGLFTEQWVPVQPTEWLGFAWLGIITDAVAYLVWALALQGSDNSAAISNLAYLTPFLSLVLSSIVFKERISIKAVIALLFIVGGILLQVFFDGKKQVKQVKNS